ncbi:MAG: hypothetical protein OXU27_00240 [Candidatus Poribacteria bacterium]|nr:hypothetical protein [Candidatus Poribacteria bacterium]
MYHFRRFFTYFCVLTLMIPFAISYEGETHPTTTCDAMTACDIEPIPFIIAKRASSFASAISDAGTRGYYSGYARVGHKTDRMTPPGQYQVEFRDGCSAGAQESETFYFRAPSMRANAGVSNQHGGDASTSSR